VLVLVGLVLLVPLIYMLVLLRRTLPLLVRVWMLEIMLVLLVLP
jgi:hypothetical protein